MNNKNSSKIYIIENKIVSLFSSAKVLWKKKGEILELSCIKLLKTNVEKMSIFRLSTMLMKTNELNISFHDVDEK